MVLDVSTAHQDAEINAFNIDLRDRFAMAALTGLLAKRTLRKGITNEQAAAVAYGLADAMMEARK